MRHHRSAVLAIALAIVVAACGSKSAKEIADEGFQSLGRSDYPAALAKFDEALSKIDAASPDYLNIKLGQIEALVYSDSAKAQTEFLALSKSQKGKVGPKEYKNVAAKLTGAKKFDDAIAVLTDGLKSFPGDDSVKKLGETIRDKAKEAGDEKAVSKMKGLGYL